MDNTIDKQFKEAKKFHDCVDELVNVISNEWSIKLILTIYKIHGYTYVDEIVTVDDILYRMNDNDLEEYYNYVKFIIDGKLKEIPVDGIVMQRALFPYNTFKFMLDEFRKQFKNINSSILDRVLSEHNYSSCYIRDIPTSGKLFLARTIIRHDEVMVKIIINMVKG